MNLTRYAIEHKTLTNFVVFLLVVGGLVVAMYLPIFKIASPF